MIFSCIIPASKRDAESQNLKDLIASIRAQDFPQDQIEILVVTNAKIRSEDIRRTDCTMIWAESDSESAKAIGIRQAKGEICAMFCADNYLIINQTFSAIKENFDCFLSCTGMYSKNYHYQPSDVSLNRYFSLIGNNDPIAFYLNKCDRRPYWEQENGEIFTVFKFEKDVPSLGDNGFFYRRQDLLQSNLNNYYPMDNALDLTAKGMGFYTRLNATYVWHRTSDNFLTFLTKRYRYARDLYCDRNDRRWKMLGTKEDYWKLAAFILCVLTVVQPLYVSIRGFIKIRDWAWFWHWPVCFGFLITYGLLVCRNLIKHGALFQRSVSSSRHSAAVPS